MIKNFKNKKRWLCLGLVLSVCLPTYEKSSASGLSELDDAKRPRNNMASGQGAMAGNEIHRDVNQTYNKGGEGGRAVVNNYLGSPASPHPKTAADYYNEGRTYLDEVPPNYKQASLCFLHAVGAAEQHMKVEAYIQLAVCKRGQKEFSDALRHYQHALELEPNDTAYRGLMELHYEFAQDAEDDDIDYLVEELQKAQLEGDKIGHKDKNIRKMLKQIKERLTQVGEQQQKTVATPCSSAAAAAAPIITVVNSIPPIASGYEAIYRRFMNGRLVYNGPSGERSFLIADIVNESLEGEFNLAGLTFTYDNKTYALDEYLRIKVGYRTTKEDELKTTVWLVPKFIIDKSTSSFKSVAWASDIGIFWSWGYNEVDSFSYLTSFDFDEISSENLHELALRGCAPRSGISPVARAGAWVPYALWVAALPVAVLLGPVGVLAQAVGWAGSKAYYRDSSSEAAHGTSTPHAAAGLACEERISFIFS